MGDRPGIGNAGGIGNQVGSGNRANIGINNRTNNIRGGDTNIGIAARGPTYVNRPTGGWYGGGYRPPYYGLHQGWYNGGWGWARPAATFAAGAAFGWLAAPDEQIVYSNPYYEPVATESVTYLNYAQPIASPTPVTVDVPVEVPVDVQVKVPESAGATGAGLDDAQKSAQDQAVELFDQASTAFQEGKYAEAQRLVEQAIAKLPGDTTLHEFRALTLFAQKKYKDAASAIYAVLAAGPGWDWQSLKAFYPDVKTYTAQLRDLEEFQRANPNAGYASMLLAYHYLTLEYVDEAIKQLQNALKAEPKDQLSKQLLAALQKADVSEERPRPKGVTP